MAFEIQKFISDKEILIRYVFKSDFKRKNVLKDKVNFANFLQPYNGGVSLQRESYCNEKEAKCRVKEISTKVFVGFYIFKKDFFNKIKQDYCAKDRNGFEAEIFATPLDLDQNYLSLPINKKIFKELKGNPSHADLVYINLVPKKEETPKTAIRSFVRKFFRESSLIIDKNPEESDVIDYKFIELV